eukprot:6178780-Pleurochrysis_carterae.AAC.2
MGFGECSSHYQQCATPTTVPAEFKLVTGPTAHPVPDELYFSADGLASCVSIDGNDQSHGRGLHPLRGTNFRHAYHGSCSCPPCVNLRSVQARHFRVEQHRTAAAAA